MRILVVTHDTPFDRGSGVAVYCHDLETELLRRGHDVVHLFSAERDWRMVPHLRWSVEQGITVASLVNAPQPPTLSPERPLNDCAHPRVERLFEACLGRARPDLVHIHSLRGLPGSVVPLARRHGLPVVVTLHDFWPICARGLLIRANGDPCPGPDGGRNCARFCADHGPLRRRLYRRMEALAPSGRPRELLQRVRARVMQAIPGDHGPWTAPPGRPGQNSPDPSAIAAHGTRAASLLRSLREASAILAVSDFVQDRLLRLGLSLPAVRWRARQPRTPVRIGFLGRVVPLKGARILAEAVRGIPPDRARVLFFGPAAAEAVTELVAAAGRPLEFRGPYRREDLAEILDEVDIAVVPTLFQETVGLATLEAQAAGIPVVASRTGAIPEHVENGTNGLLFEPGDARALGQRLRLLIDTPELAAAMSARTVPPMAIGRHVDLLADVYRRCLDAQTRSPYAVHSA
ncbi:MAG: glycosyltransferase [Bacillati bacterium ANGP1]|uniref:Glycosyltransferase n=2 Tax=Candidatus Segetimicrobium genomatis TaxID=2569760 RepID=A0A537IXZ2_9BACT|nr:MAG: glycosyltransferase [Terrabacteria group bacterium ANGP1]